MSKLRIMIDKGEMVEISRQFLETLIERSTLIRRLQTGINWCKMIKDIFIMQRKNVWRKIFKDNALGKLLKDLFQDIEKMITQFKELEKSLFKVWVDKY